MLEKFDQLFNDGFINSMISIAILLVLLFIVNHIINSFLNKKFKKELPMLKRIKKIIITTIALAGILSQFKALEPILSGLLASGGVLALVIGLASQEVASDILSGVMIFVYKPYRIGDLIFVSDHNVKGTVLDITIRHTIIETVEKTQVTIPNTIMNKAIVENISNVTNQKNNYLYVDIAYESDMEKAILAIQETAMAHPYFVDPRSKEEKKNNIPAVKVHCVEFKDSGIALRASIFTKDNAHGFQLLSDVRIAILKRFEQDGIEIPYPHTVIIKK